MNYELIAKAVEEYKSGDYEDEYTLDEFVEEYLRECRRDAEYDEYFGGYDVSPNAYQEDLIAMRRFEQ